MGRTSPKFINREISWLAFNKRVLQEAQDTSVPLIERLRFLGIFSNNLDEFFRVRVATLTRMLALGVSGQMIQDDNPADVLKEIYSQNKGLQKAFDLILADLETELEKEQIHVYQLGEELTQEQQEFVTDYFANQIRPVLVPIMVRKKQRFPSLKDTSIYLAIRLLIGGKSSPNYALVEIPSNLKRFVRIPDVGSTHHVMFIDDIIRMHLKNIFSIFDVDEADAYTIKVTRDAELDLEDDISVSIIENMSKSVDKRKKGSYVRFLYDEAMPDDMREFMAEKLGIKDRGNQIPGGRYHNKKNFMSFPDFGRKDLIFPRLAPLDHPQLKNKRSIIQQILKKDILLNYPYQKFTYIIDLLREAAIDPQVRSIRINLYRVAANSQVINALISAAQNGKKVIVIIELQARFDESNNIHWSNVLQDGGVKVHFSSNDLKVHSKLILISRKKEAQTIRLAHIGTGNFHEGTARVYGDTALLTADPKICAEVKKVFDLFERSMVRPTFRHLIVSPFNTRRKFGALIDQEIRNAKAGKEAWIVIKLNNLVDRVMIRKLYKASMSGVRIRLIIRGICSLVPGMKGYSENIEVVSIVGRFLEHSRILSFANAGEPLYYISSADWMGRNLDRRIEVSVPVWDPSLKHELKDYLELQLADNVKSRIVDLELTNAHKSEGRKESALNSQELLYRHFEANLK